MTNEKKDRIRITETEPTKWFITEGGRARVVSREEYERHQAGTPPMYDKEEVLKTLAEEGTVLVVNAIDEVTVDSIIAAQHNCIMKMQRDRANTSARVYEQDNHIGQFYRAAQIAGLSISRDEENKIKLSIPKYLTGT